MHSLLQQQVMIVAIKYYFSIFDDEIKDKIDNNDF